MRRFAICILLVVLAASARAQFDTATVLGTVTDPSGAVVARCNVVLHNTATAEELTAATDDRGEYRFVDVSIGTYELKVTAQGFQAAAAKFELTVGARQRVDVQLKVASATSSVTATAEATQLETESSERGQVVNEREIAELPLNGREYSQLVELTAGVVPSPAELGTNYTQREGSFDINGLRSVYNNYLLDGLDNNFYGTSNQGFSNQVVQLSPDAVAEFQVVTNNMGAEYGRAGGATINVVTRFGTNQLHGRVWEFLRNTNMNAAGFFLPSNGSKPPLHQNQFGGTLGGPIKKDKLFFFIDYEGFRQASSSIQTSTLPTAAERGLSSTGTALGYYLIDDPNDPNNSKGYLPIDNPCPYVGPNGGPDANPNPCNTSTEFAGGLLLSVGKAGGQEYTNGQIPASAVINYAATILEGKDVNGNLYLPPNTNANSTNNYIILDPSTFNRDKGDAKVDYDVRPNLRLFARYSQARFDAFDPGSIAGTAGANGDGHVYAPVKQIVGGATWTISPKSLFEARFGFSQMQAGKTPPLVGGPSMQTMFGITGLPPQGPYSGGISYEYFVDGGFTSLGRLFTSPQYQNPTVWNPKVNYTRLLPGHTLKAGLEYQMLHVAQEDLHPVMGGDAYDAQMSGTCYDDYYTLFYAPNVPLCAVVGDPAPSVLNPVDAETNKMFDYADFLLGYRTEMGLTSPTIAQIRDWGLSGYVQDDWKVSRRLTVNLGLRYEYYTPIYEANNQLSNFNPSTMTMTLASSSNRYTVNPNKKDFAPRFGAAFSINDQTVMRGGFGLSYSHWNRTGSSYLTLNAPFGIDALQFVYPSYPANAATGTYGYLNTEASFPTNMANPATWTIADAQDAALQYMPQSSPDTQVRSWFLSVQRDMGHSLLVDVAYVGNDGVNEVFFNDVNQGAPQTTATGSVALTCQPEPACHTAGQERVFSYPGFGSIIGTLPWGYSNYNGLQVKVEKRFSEGLYLLNSFTYSKAIDIAAQSLDGGGNCNDCGNGIPSVQNVYNWQADHGISAYNHPLVNATSVVWSLPAGKGQWLLPNASRALDEFVGGWQLTNIFQARSGNPLTMAYNPSNNAEVSGLITISGRNSYRPNLTPRVPLKNSTWAYNTALSGIQYLNNSNTTPAYTTPPANVPFGNSPRDGVRGFGFWQLDTGLTKDFALEGRYSLQLRAEAFNITNETNFGDPNTSLGGNFGVVNSTLPARELQVAGKIVF
jgi:outer membrane receptor protein involved in Fe transport